MKIFAFTVKYIIAPLGTIGGLYFAFDGYIVNRANTAIEPTKVKVESIGKNVAEITVRTRNIEKILMERK